ncbi:universal stress protein [Capilliphycus salinus ALCB114379]|uniref:universal stress protein n=1 Tax=Capilliphycus salinus TaxID=2768948 RepID=UPI0039A552F6
MSYNKVLAALDRSSQGEDVFQQALDIARTQNAELLLIFCMQRLEQMPTVPPVEATTGTGLHPLMRMYPAMSETEVLQTTEQEIKRAKEEADRWLQNYQIQAEDQGVHAQYQCVSFAGNPGEQICKMAKEWNADLTVVGRTGRTGLEEAFLGSVSNHVVHHAPCSVLVVQDNN